MSIFLCLFVLGGFHKFNHFFLKCCAPSFSSSSFVQPTMRDNTLFLGFLDILFFSCIKKETKISGPSDRDIISILLLFFCVDSFLSKFSSTMFSALNS